jgi:diguanylate cyclase
LGVTDVKTFGEKRKRNFTLRLFRIGAAVRAESSDTVLAEDSSSMEGARRDELLDRIRDFFVENELEVTAPNLVAAHAAFSGASMRLARKLELMRAEGRIVTQQWLDEATAEIAGAPEQSEESEAAFTQLSGGLDAFSQVTRSARSATGQYQSDLETHAKGLANVDSTADMIASLTQMARVMIERTQVMEDSMRRSEEEAVALRASLARAKKDANIDHLTGLPNRRAFEVALDREYREAKAAIDSLSVAFCDIDHFKRVNDTHGHDTGDRVIQAVAQALKRISNDRCHVARHGGEEFVMLFRDKSPAQVHKLLDEARERLSQRNFVNRKSDEEIGHITFSGGVVNVFAYPDARAALEGADAALYRAKRSGRNQICMA